MSYLLGSALFGILAERYGWSAGFYLLLFAVVGCIFCCFMTTLASSVWNGKNWPRPKASNRMANRCLNHRMRN